MKKILKKAAVLMTAMMFITMNTVAFAAEEESALDASSQAEDAPLLDPQQASEFAERMEEWQKDFEEKQEDPLSTEKQFEIIQQTNNEKYNQSTEERPEMNLSGKIIYILILSCIVTLIRSATRKKKNNNDINNTYDPNGTNNTSPGNGTNDYNNFN